MHLFKRMGLAAFIAIFLLLGMVCHAIHFDHEHPEEIFGAGLEAAHHSQDKKWWLAVLLVSFLSYAFTSLFIKKEEPRIRITQEAVYRERSKILNPLFFGLMKGILNPKIF